VTGATIQKRRTALTAALVLLAAFAFLLVQRVQARESPADRATRLSRQHGLTVSFGDPSTFYTAPYGAKDAHIEFTEVLAADPVGAAPALDGIEEALLRYPPGFVAGLAHGIFICGNLKIQGAEAGGTVGPAWIILAAPVSIGPASIRLTSLLGVHHELSSLVLARRADSLAEWTAFTPADWRFQRDSAGALSQAKDEDPPPATGFLSAYGATTPENDFNVYAEKMFTEPETVAKLAARYPLVAKKAAFVASTYAAIDPRLRETFAKLGLGLVSAVRSGGASSR
jgi:hypothetical protein